MRRSTASQWHLSGTARMGRADDPTAVVDTAGRVHGVGGLRVCDASVMPRVTNGKRPPVPAHCHTPSPTKRAT